MPDFKKHLSLKELLGLKAQIEDANFWRALCPNSSISNFLLDDSKSYAVLEESEIANYQSLVCEEGYFQTKNILPKSMQEEMRFCIEKVKEAGFPAMFALVYDVFYEAFQYFNPIMKHLLGEDYVLIPNFWVYYIETSDDSKGFEPHRDAEYPNTIGADGKPNVLTLWITITDATPLNSCMYVLPAQRDPEYKMAISDIKVGATKFNLEDVRAIPANAGVLSCWDQYLYHWGSRSSHRASEPRISYALYCQRGDIPPFDDVIIDLRKGLIFEQRLGFICRGVYKYSYVNSDANEQTPELLAFLENNMNTLKK